jgi:long-chain acyl-CoA synthetase
VVQKYRPTTTLTIPYLIADLLEIQGLEPLDSLRNYIIGGTMVPKVIYEKLKRFVPNAKISNAYGSTEIGGISNFAENRVDSIGQLTRNMEMKIVDEDGCNLGSEEVGEICIKPPVRGLVRMFFSH